MVAPGDGRYRALRAPCGASVREERTDGIVELGTLAKVCECRLVLLDALEQQGFELCNAIRRGAA
eukprot:3235164-Prymnesium_polylepis.1